MDFDAKDVEVLLVEKIPEPYLSMMEVLGPMTREEADKLLLAIAKKVNCQVSDIKYFKSPEEISNA